MSVSSPLQTDVCVLILQTDVCVLIFHLGRRLFGTCSVRSPQPPKYFLEDGVAFRCSGPDRMDGRKYVGRGGQTEMKK